MLSSHEDKIELPAEWEPQSATLLVWPHKDSDWHATYDEIETTYLNLCKAISAYQKLLIVCRDEKLKGSIINQLGNIHLNQDNYALFICDYNDTWCRDYGPLVTRQNGIFALKNFIFNGWGNKYPAQLDNQITQCLYKQNIFKPLALHNHDFVLEGGSIDSDGRGTLLATTNCLQQRHPGKSKQQLASLLHQYLGVNNIHWLEHGKILGDDTDGHIDMLARFINPETIAYSACKDSNNPNYTALKKMEQELSALKTNNGETYTLVPLLLPEPKMNHDRLLPATYVNFSIINQAVLVPTYDDAQDHIALETLKLHFPQRDIIGINANTLIKQFGSLHCATLNIPAGVIH